MLPTFGSKCMNGHDGVRFCTDKKCEYSATICEKETCLWSTKHNRCNGCVCMEYFIEKMKRREQDGRRMDAVLECYEKMIKRIEIEKKEYERMKDLDRRDSGNEDQEFFGWLKENSSREIDSKRVNNAQKMCKKQLSNQIKVDKVGIDQIQNKFENVLIQMKKLWNKFDGLSTNRSQIQLKSQSSSLELLLNNNISNNRSLKGFLNKHNKSFKSFKKVPFTFTYFKISNNLQIYNNGNSIRNYGFLKKQIYHIALISPSVLRDNSSIRLITNTPSNIQFGIFDKTNIQSYQLSPLQLENYIIFPTTSQLTPQSINHRSTTSRSYRHGFSPYSQLSQQTIQLSINFQSKTFIFQNLTKQIILSKHISINKNNPYYFGIVLQQKGNVTICQ